MIRLGGYHPVPKVTKKKNKSKPSMAVRKKFSKSSIQKAIDYWEGLCANCRSKPPNDPHHIRFKSDNGKGVYTNCLPLCRECHNEIHRNPELAIKWRRWARKEFGSSYWKDKWDD